MGRVATLVRMLFCFTNRKLDCTLRARCLQKGFSVWFTVKPSLVKLAHSSYRAEWNTGELCLRWSVLLCEMCRKQSCTSVRLVISPSSGVCIRGFLCHVMVSWLWEAFCSATLQPVHLFCQAWNPAVPRRIKWVWEIPSAGICTLGEYNCFAYSSVEQIPLVRSCNLCASSYVKNSKLESRYYLAKLIVELHNFIANQSTHLSVF